MNSKPSEVGLEYWKIVDAYLISKETGYKNDLDEIFDKIINCNYCGKNSVAKDCINEIDKDETIFSCPKCNTQWLTHKA